jgi:hypothetical protein
LLKIPGLIDDSAVSHRKRSDFNPDHSGANAANFVRLKAEKCKVLSSISRLFPDMPSEKAERIFMKSLAETGNKCIGFLPFCPDYIEENQFI